MRVAIIFVLSKPAQQPLRGLFACCTASGLRHFAGSAVLLFSLQGCATLPDAAHEMTLPHPQQVEFKGPQGPVSAAKSDAILEQLEGKGGDSDLLQEHLAYMQALSPDSPLVLSNNVTLLQNGPETYEAMFAAIRTAKDHINLETYIFDDGEAGQKFASLLLERQAAGVQVNIIYDSVGGISTPQEFFDRLRAGGIRVLEFNPLNPLAANAKPWLLNNRDHRRQLVVDGRIAFTGGINISDTYSSTPSGKRARKKRAEKADADIGWRDTHIQIEGPVVAEFQKLFIETWTKKIGGELAEKSYFPELKAQGDEIVRALGSSPDDGDNPIYLTLMSAISHARLTLHLTIAYFAPDPQLLKALTDAAKRGVDVALVLPSHSDSWPIFHLGRSHYTRLLRGGVRIYERRGTVMHAKTVCIDGVWSTIGSTNLDWRSFLHNDEINAVILGQGFARQMETMFAQDIAESDAIALERWRHRPWINRLKEWAAQIGEYWL